MVSWLEWCCYGHAQYQSVLTSLSLIIANKVIYFIYLCLYILLKMVTEVSSQLQSFCDVGGGGRGGGSLTVHQVSWLIARLNYAVMFNISYNRTTYSNVCQ